MSKGFMVYDFNLVHNLVRIAIFTLLGSHKTHHNALR